MERSTGARTKLNLRIVEVDIFRDLVCARVCVGLLPFASVACWNRSSGHYGWLKTDTEIEHEAKAMRGGKIYVNRSPGIEAVGGSLSFAFKQ